MKEKKRNRRIRRNPSSNSWHYCDCDRAHISESTKCPVCGKRPTKIKGKKRDFCPINIGEY